MQFYGTPLPGVEHEEYSGKLIVIEGTDGVGRSTHIAGLRTWLESRGHAVLDTGMTRSILAGRGIKEAKRGTTMPAPFTQSARQRVERICAGTGALRQRR